MVANIISLIQQFGLLIVFANVFCEQIGLPVPAYPTLLVTGALLSQGNYSVSALLFVAVGGSLIADVFWFLSGRKYGNKVMAKLCRISLSPDSCVRQTESIYLRTGHATLLFCKFVPGLSTVSSALAGTLGTKLLTFLIFDSLGAVLWAGSAILLGTLFSNAIDDLLNILVEMGKWGGVLIALGLAAFIASKWWQRHRFIRSLRMAQISVSELDRMLSRGLKPTIIDVRPLHLQDSGVIPGAISVSIEKVDTVILDASVDDEIILYCACPNEVTSARVAKMLMKKGYKRVRPLTGGIDAWVDAGHPTTI